ncbi:MAG: phage holin family protein [Clostridia bacterium]|nr:phage holin family protein [Clostridia bacterium]
MKYKEVISAAAGTAGAIIVKLTGGWNGALCTLLIFMAADYLTGLILAAVFKKSPKSNNGSLESRAGWKGLARKGITLLIVMLAFRLDALTNQSFIASGVIIAFITNEAISITENAALIGIPLPNALIKAIDVMKTNSEHMTANNE